MTVVALAVPLALSGPLTPAWAADSKPKPSTLTLIGSDAVVGISDLGAKGPTPGDTRTLSLALSSTKGAPMGRASIVQVLVLQSGAVGTAMKTVVLSLPRGSISVVGTTEFTDITDPASRPNEATEQLAVVGGTGAYRGASGQVDIAVLPEFKSRWTISLDRK